MESTPPILFDRARIRKHRARRAARFAEHDALLREMAERLADAMASMRYRFPTVIELGSHTGQLAALLADRAGTTRYVSCDLALPMLRQCSGLRVAADEEYLPFAENSADAVVSIGALHLVNDLPGTLVQIRRILKPDGLFLALLPGVESLREWRQIGAETDAAYYGGIAPRVAPLIDVRDAGALLQRAGFALPVAESETLTVLYKDVSALLADLRGGAQSGVLRARAPLTRGWLQQAMQRYAAHFAHADSEISATLELITLTAWKPAKNQQQPARRGSGKISLKDALR